MIEPFDFGSEEFGGQDKTCSLNFRVAQVDKVVAQLIGAEIGVAVDDVTYPNCRSAKLKDPEGNLIELWQPMGPLHRQCSCTKNRNFEC